jgi:hypothetical protein
MFGNRVPRRTFGPKREEVGGAGEDYIMRSFITIIRVIQSRRMRWAENIARMAEMRNAYNILVGKQERKRPLGRPRCR